MMATLQRRASLRGVFTRSANTLEELLNLAEFTEDVSNLEIAFELLSEKYKQLRRAEDEYLEELQKGETTQQNYDAEYASREKYEDRFISLKVKANNMKTKQRELLRSKKNENLDVSFSEVRQVKLPEIELKRFDGNPRDWLSFWAQFGKIHDDSKIYDGDKFQYLIRATVPGSKARTIVDSFPASPQNYPKTVEYLKERFGQDKVLIQVYIRDLLQLVISKPKGDIASLYDRLQTQLRSLESLGLTKDKYADVLFPMVESALPVDIIALWERQRSQLTCKRCAKFFNATRNLSTTKNVCADARIKELQRLFQVDDGVPVHLKKGASDKIMVAFAFFAVGLATLDGLVFCYKMVYPPKNG